MSAAYKFKHWQIFKNGNSYSATNGKGFFTAYHVCECTGAFLDVLNSQYAAIH